MACMDNNSLTYKKGVYNIIGNMIVLFWNGTIILKLLDDCVILDEDNHPM